MRDLNTYFLEIPDHFNQYYLFLKNSAQDENKYSIQVEIRKESQVLHYLILTTSKLCLILDLFQMKEIPSQLQNIFDSDWNWFSAQKKNWTSSKIKLYVLRFLQSYPAQTGWTFNPNTNQHYYAYPINFRDFDELFRYSRYSLPDWFRICPKLS